MEKDKRYLVFTYDTYYPGGGMSDMEASFDTIQEAVEFFNKRKYDHGEIYDRIEGVEVAGELYGAKY